MTSTMWNEVLVPAIATLCALLVSLALAALGLFLANGVMRERRTAAASLQWPATPGQITVAEIRTGRTTHPQFDSHGSRAGTRTEMTHHPLFNYAYTVAGQPFTCYRIGFNNISDSDEAGAEKVTRQYAVGTAVTVYYDPANPQESVLDRTTPKRLWRLIFSVLALTVSACCCVNLAVGLLSAALQRLPR